MNKNYRVITKQNYNIEFGNYDVSEVSEIFRDCEVAFLDNNGNVIGKLKSNLFYVISNDITDELKLELLKEINDIKFEVKPLFKIK